MAFMGELGVGEPCNRPKTGMVLVLPTGDVSAKPICGATVPRRNRSKCTCGYTRTRGWEDSVDTLSDLLSLCRGIHAHTNDRRSVCGTSRRGNTCQRRHVGDCEEHWWFSPSTTERTTV